jgi:hypothetical protein
MAEVKYWVWMASLKLGTERYVLLDHFGDAKELYYAGNSEISEALGRRVSFDRDEDAAIKTLDDCARE